VRVIAKQLSLLSLPQRKLYRIPWYGIIYSFPSIDTLVKEEAALNALFVKQSSFVSFASFAYSFFFGNQVKD
jgi:hypothetical protein